MPDLLLHVHICKQSFPAFFKVRDHYNIVLPFAILTLYSCTVDQGERVGTNAAKESSRNSDARAHGIP